MIISGALATCNEHKILTSQNFHCISSSDESECLVNSYSQITLQNLDYEACLWLSDESNDNTMQLRIKLIKAQCSWQTSLMYYTFPVKWSVITALHCNYDEFCAYLHHCSPSRNFFPEMTEESRVKMGKTYCVPVTSVLTRCALVAYQSCYFSRIFLDPEYDKSYEVRKLMPNECSYEIQVTLENNQTQTVSLSDSVAITPNIHLAVIGSYDQPAHFESSHVIVSTNNPSEAYLETASARGRPEKFQIGSVQANSSFAKTFIYAEDEYKCSAYQSDVHCERSESYLDQMLQTRERQLPLVEGFHSFQISNSGALTSDLLNTQPVNVGLSLTNHKFRVKLNNVCPHFEADTSFEVDGLYPSDRLAELKFQVYCSCSEGQVSVQFDIIKIATRSVKLHTRSQVIVVQFKAESRCETQKICLMAKVTKICRTFSYCLREGTIDLRRMNYTYLSSNAWNIAPYNGWSMTSLFTGIMN